MLSGDPFLEIAIVVFDPKFQAYIPLLRDLANENATHISLDIHNQITYLAYTFRDIYNICHIYIYVTYIYICDIYIYM